MRPIVLSIIGFVLLFAAGASAQGLLLPDDQLGGTIDNQFCGIQLLQQLDLTLKDAADLTGGKGQGGKHGTGKKNNGRRLASSPEAPQPDEEADAWLSSADMLAAYHGPYQEQQRSDQVSASAAVGNCKPPSANSPEAVYHVAAAPEVFHSWDGNVTAGGVNLLPAVRDQGSCKTCVAMAVAAAAEASYASVLHKSALELSFPARYMYYCGGDKPDRRRTCGSGWSIKDAVQVVESQLSVLQPCRKLPKNDADPRGLTPQGNNPMCQRADQQCPNPPPPSASPNCTWKVLDRVWKVQRHIRMYGAAVTRLSVPINLGDTQFSDFFKDNPTRVYRDNITTASFPHAIVLFGYDNVDRHWVALNSWGAGFADGGVFRIAYGIGGVANPDETYGPTCFPSQQDTEAQLRLSQLRVPVRRLSQQPGCYTYRFNASLTPDASYLAAFLGISLVELVRNNTPTVFPVVNVSFASSSPPEVNCTSAAQFPCVAAVQLQVDASEGTYNVTMQQPDVLIALDGQLLKLCIPPRDEKKQPLPFGADCAPGNQTTAADRGRCEVCPVNTIKPASGPGSCQACPGGAVTLDHYSDTPTSSNLHDKASDCYCPIGTYRDKADGTCKTCGANQFNNDARAEECYRCPPGQITLNATAGGTEDGPGYHDSIYDCLCPSGMQRKASFKPDDYNTKTPPTSSVCELCPANTFKDASTFDDDVCRSCPYGTLAPGNRASDHAGPHNCKVPWLTVAAAEQHTCGLVMPTGRAAKASKPAGVMRCWGDDSSDQASPPPTEDWTAVSTGFDRTCGIKSGTAQLVCFGDVPHEQQPAGSWAAVAIGESHTVGLTADDTLQCLGACSVPASLATERFVRVVAGSAHSCALHTNSSAASCWRNDAGSEVYWLQLQGGAMPVLSAAYDSTCAVSSVGRKLACWSASGKRLNLPAAVSNQAWRDVSVGNGFVCGISRDKSRQLLCFALTARAAAVPIVAPAADGKPIPFQSISAGSDYVCGIVANASRNAVCFSSRTTPKIYRKTVVPSSVFLVWLAVSLGSSHGCGITAPDNALRCWGDDGACIPRDDTTGCSKKDTSQHWIGVAAGKFITCAVAKSGAVKCFSSVPDQALTPPVLEGGYSAVTVGDPFACGRSASNPKLLRCWGDAAPKPPPVDDGDGWLSLASTASSMCALTDSYHSTRPVCVGRSPPSPPKLRANEWLSLMASGLKTTCAQQIDVERTVTSCWRRSLLGTVEPSKGRGPGGSGSPKGSWGSSGSSTCTVEKYGFGLTCWPQPVVDFTQGRQLAGLGVGDKRTCAIVLPEAESLQFVGANTAGELLCEPPFNGTKLVQGPPDGQKWVAVSVQLGIGQGVCAIADDGILDCFELSGILDRPPLTYD